MGKPPTVVVACSRPDSDTLKLGAIAAGCFAWSTPVSGQSHLVSVRRLYTSLGEQNASTVAFVKGSTEVVLLS
jgi:hypothetical protein